MIGSNGQEIADSYRAFEQLHKAGVNLTGVLDHFLMLADRKERNTVRFLISSLRKGDSLWEAMDKSGAYRPFDVELIRAGEKSGFLPEICSYLSERYSLEYVTSRTLTAGLVQPALLFLAVVFIPPIPRLVNGEISLIQYLAETLGVILCLVALIYAVRWAYSRTRWNARLAALRERALGLVPGLRRLLRMVQIERFCSCWSMMLKAGYPMTTAIESAGRTGSDPALAWATQRISGAVEKKENLYRAVARESYFLPGFSSYVLTGVESGRLDEMLEKISADYRYDISRYFNLISKMIPRGLYVFMLLFALVATLLRLRSQL